MIDDPQTQSSYEQADPNANAVGDSPVGGTSPDDNQRILARQIPSGTQRGTQQTTGQTFIIDPDTNNPVFTTSGITQNQTLSNPVNGSPQIITGKQSDGFYAMKFFDTDGVGIARFGQFEDGSTALKVAPVGVEVDTAADNELVFNSSQNVFKIVKVLTGTLPSVTVNPGAGNYGSTFSTVSLNHDLGFIPAFQAYYQTGSTFGAIPSSFSSNTGAATAFWRGIEVFSTRSQINFQLSMLSFGINIQAGPFNVKAYVLQETAN